MPCALWVVQPLDLGKQPLLVLEAVLRVASVRSFEALAWFPAALIVIFGCIWFSDRRRVASP